MDSKKIEGVQQYIEYFQQIIQVEVINKIKQQVDLFQNKTGISKTYIAKRLGMSKQALSETFKSENPGRKRKAC